MAEVLMMTIIFIPFVFVLMPEKIGDIYIIDSYWRSWAWLAFVASILLYCTMFGVDFS